MKNGFTIIELMLTVAVAAVVLALGVPSFVGSIRDNRLASQTNILLSAINFTRSEAVKLGNSNVTICGSSDSASCNSTNWEAGWIIFRDANGNGAVDGADIVLRIQEPLTGGNTLRPIGFSVASHVTFNNRGTTPQQGTLKLCDSRGASKARGVVINISGQARTATDDNVPNDNLINIHSGGNITCP